MDKIEFNLTLPVFKDQTFNIMNFGAKADSDFLNTEAINSAIDECNKNGGGTVVIPRGIFVTGPIIFKSNVNLHLESGAVVLFTPDYDKYPLIDTSWEGFFTYRCISPIYGKELENIAITGSGVFDGNGFAWRPVKKFKMTEKAWENLVKSGGVVSKGKEEIWWPTEAAMEAHKEIIPNPSILRNKELCQKYRDYLRPVLLNFTKCKNILIEGVTFQNSPAWCLHPWQCEHLRIKNINVRNPWFSQNGDGIDVDSCKYVYVSDSTFDVGDDALCVKSGKNEDGRKLGISCENVIFENCTVYHGHGGFVVGSEMSGGVTNVHVSNCTFIGTDTGLRFKSCLGRGGTVDNIFIDNINMTDIAKEAIIFTTGYDMDTKEGQQVSEEEIPEFKNIYIQNVNCLSAETPISITGLKTRPIHDITLKNISIVSDKEIAISYAENIVQENVKIKKH